MSLSWQQAGSRNSVNYDLNSYEAKRLLNLVEEPSYDAPPPPSIVPEDQFRFSFAEPSWNINPPQPLPPSATPATIPRNNSDMSLFTPMRRRSLLTPGLATRMPDPPLVIEVPPIPKKSKARLSPQSISPHRDSAESFGLNVYSYSLSPDADSVPRVVTPCEDAYQQTGAFKLGTLRIMNGSPIASPSSDVTPIPDRNLRAELSADGSRGYAPNVTTAEEPSSPQYLTEFYESPITADQLPVADGQEFQATSKHTAVEDELFEDDQQEYSRSEVLDVRLDLHAKSLPPRPAPVTQFRESVEIFRSDSGIVTSPRSDYAKKPLAKTDSGYSSNVSLRSYSARPPVPEKDGNKPLTHAVVVAPQASRNNDSPPQTPPKDEFPGESMRLPSFESVVRPPVDCPPPVPSKDFPPGSQPLKNSQSVKVQPSRLRNQPRASRRATSLQSPTEDGRTRATSLMSPSALSPLSATSSTSTSTLSEGSGTRKHGKLDRFLSGSRVSADARETSDLVGVPPVPRDVQARLNGRMSVFQAPRKRLALRQWASRETLGTIMSVGSAEYAQFDDAQPANSPSPRDRKPGAGTSIRRKPVPIRVPAQTVRVEAEAKNKSDTHSRSHSDPSPQKEDDGNLDPAFLAMADERDAYFAPSHDVHRSNTMSARVERNIGLHSDATTGSYGTPAASSPTSAPAGGQVQRAKAAPPVSMITRNRGTLRVPTPLRARSTPPARRNTEAGRLSRRASRENINSYPPSADPRARASFSRNQSRENIWSYPSTQGHYDDLEYDVTEPPEDSAQPRRSMSITTDHGEYRVPIWDIQTDHETSSSSGSSSGHNRSNSLASRGSQRSRRSSRMVPGADHPGQLRYRASHDGIRYQQVDNAAMISYQDNGPYPSIHHADGQAYVSDPWSGQPIPQLWDAQGRYPPYVPRHSRNNSLGSHGISAPYRVLHSYNSPAYRHAPIWG